MKVRKLTILFVFVLGIISLFSCGKSKPKSQESNSKNLSSKEKTSMKQVIETDNSFGKIRNHQCENISLSQTIANYVQAMEAYRMEDCPKEFTDAFARHREAWRNMLVITDEYPDMRGEMHQLFDSIEKGKDSTIFKSRLKAIWDTWSEVETAMN